MNKTKTIWTIIGAIVVIIVCAVLSAKYLDKPVGMVSENTYVPTVAPVVTTSSTAPGWTMAKSTSTFVVTVSAPSGEKSFQNASYAFSYPANWTIGSGIPTPINNFGAPTWQGGGLPKGG